MRNVTFRHFLQDDAGAGQPAGSSRQAMNNPRPNTATVLIVEDESLLRDLVKDLLEEGGYRVLTTGDGEEAIDLYEKCTPKIDVVLSDLGLPSIPGEEVFRRLKRLDPEVRFVFATGMIDPRLTSEMLKAGAAAFVHKPYDANEVLQKIHQALTLPSRSPIEGSSL